MLTDPSRRPHILIATPGRLVDHIVNTPNFDLHSLQMLVFDEADRLLENGFTKQINDILDICPSSESRFIFFLFLIIKNSFFLNFFYNSIIKKKDKHYYSLQQ